MTDHLPECWAKHESDPPAWCICDELRACEERVLKDTVPGEWHEKRIAWVRKDALDAAREAVEAIPAPYKIRGVFETFGAYSEGKADFKDLAISAIIAIKESND